MRSALDENPNCLDTHASFRLGGDELDPDEVTAALGASPSVARAKGQEIPFGRKAKTTIRQLTGIWVLSSEDAVSSTSLERHLAHLLDTIEPAAEQLALLRRQRDLQADFFCYWVSAHGHGGPVLSPGTLARIAALDLELSIDFYDGNPRSATDVHVTSNG